MFETTTERLSKKFLNTYFRNHGFHVCQIRNVVLTHQEHGIKCPLSVEVYIAHASKIFKITYKNITKFYINYDNDIKDTSGFDDWGYDEFLPIDEQYLSHEILFAPGATILIHFKIRTHSSIRWKKLETHWY